MTAHEHDERLAREQREHWQHTYRDHPGMYGEQPSAPAYHAARLFHDAGARDVLELGAGHGRDALYFAREGFTVHAPTSAPPACNSAASGAPRRPARTLTIGGILTCTRTSFAVGGAFRTSMSARVQASGMRPGRR